MSALLYEATVITTFLVGSQLAEMPPTVDRRKVSTHGITHERFLSLVGRVQECPDVEVEFEPPFVMTIVHQPFQQDGILIECQERYEYASSQGKPRA